MESTNNNAMNAEMENKSVSEIFAEMDNAVDNFFKAADNFVAEMKKKEEEKMVFVITRTEHYKGEEFKGVEVIEAFDFESVAKKFDFDAEGSTFLRARFGRDNGRAFKTISEMRVGTILKLDKGMYIQRIK